MKFQSYTPETAPAKSKDVLSAVTKKYGMTPNIFAHMAESPLPIDVYNYAQALVAEKGTLSAEEINIVQLAVSVFNECQFCVAAHSTIARGMIKTDSSVIDAIREGRQGPNAKYNSLVSFTQKLADKRGKLSDAEKQAFLDAGYTKEQIFEVLTIVAYKTITNYTSQLAGTQPNEAFAAETWDPSSIKKKAA